MNKKTKRAAESKPTVDEANVPPTLATLPKRGKKPSAPPSPAPNATDANAAATGAKTPVEQPAPAKRLGALDAAAVVLADSPTPMKAVDMIAAMQAKELWSSPTGKTPEATLYAAIIREIAAKGPKSRFRKFDRSLFTIRKVED